MLNVLRVLAGSLLLFMTAAYGEDIKDIEYGQAGKVTLRLDAHIPHGEGPFAAAVLIHGGAWVAGDRTNNVRPLMEPLSKANIAWFSISYRLAADVARNPIGAAMQLGTAESDVRRAVAFVREHASEYHLDPQKIVLIGESAGGQLASMAALRPDPGGVVQGVVAFYTPSDLATLVRTSTLIPDNVRDSVKGTMFENILMAGLNEFSPINAVNAQAPPFLLIHGTEDNVVPLAQSERFCDKLRESNVPCEIYPVKGGGHGVRSWEYLKLTDYKVTMIQWLERVVVKP